MENRTYKFYKGAPVINWILYYPVEKWLSRYTDVLITINKEDFERAKTFKAGKVCYVPGVGIDLKKFNAGYVNKEQKRKEIGVSAFRDCTGLNRVVMPKHLKVLSAGLFAFCHLNCDAEVVLPHEQEQTCMPDCFYKSLLALGNVCKPMKRWRLH